LAATILGIAFVLGIAALLYRAGRSAAPNAAEVPEV
jgi:hypothetical protein